ncbi:MAG: RNA-binding S4 domain-containing protein [Steroidobacteraceae bacterium]
MAEAKYKPDAALRLDKWLWHARFFRTRSLATEAVAGGRVHLNGQRVKASRAVMVGDRLDISIGADAVSIDVLELPDRRGSASVARSCYRETEASIQRRERAAELRRLARLATPQTDGRPDKHTRRDLMKIRRGESIE